jgi:hypothetical protein
LNSSTAVRSAARERQRPASAFGWESWPLAGLVVLLVAVPAVSDALGLYGRVLHWGKVVHAVESGLVAAMAALLLLGYRDRAQLVLATQLAALMSIAVGVTVGACWEIVDFVLDWVRSSDLQKSNLDTMTDMLWSDVASVLASLLAVRLFVHAFSAPRRASVGLTAERVCAPVGRLLERHGQLLALLVLLAIAASIAGLWFTGRPIPGVPLD